MITIFLPNFLIRKVPGSTPYAINSTRQGDSNGAGLSEFCPGIAEKQRQCKNESAGKVVRCSWTLGPGLSLTVGPNDPKFGPQGPWGM